MLTYLLFCICQDLRESWNECIEECGSRNHLIKGGDIEVTTVVATNETKAQ